MSGQEGNTADWSENAQRSYKKAATLMFALIVASALLHWYIEDRQKTLATVMSIAQQQLGITQRLATLVSENMNDPNQDSAAELKKTAALALDNHLALEPWFNSVLKASNPDDAAALATVKDMRNVIETAMRISAFVASSQGEQVVDDAQQLQSTEAQMPAAWSSAVARFSAAGQKGVDMIFYASLPLYVVMLLLLGYESKSIVAPAMEYITRLREHVDHMAATDMLTGLYTRPMLFKVAGVLMSGSQRHKRGLAALAINIDGLQAINDTHGRAAGDAALKKVAATLKESLRTSDVIGRMGGDELGAFLPSTDEYRAGFAAEKLRAAVQDAPFEIKENVVLLRVSIGVAEMKDYHKTPEDVLRAAETAMRQAKANGRNCVVTWGAMHGAPAAPPAAAAKAETAG